MPFQTPNILERLNRITTENTDVLVPKSKLQNSTLPKLISVYTVMPDTRPRLIGDSEWSSLVIVDLWMGICIS